jgi:hypothetical protein
MNNEIKFPSDFTPAFHPKALNMKKMAGLLASLGLPAFSSRVFGTMAWRKVSHYPNISGWGYSCGDSSGILPDSLLIPRA